jgi:AraC-like DNA-binding protein
MFEMRLDFFTQDKKFPFFIQSGKHDSAMFTHTHADFSELTAVIGGTAMHCVNDEVYFIKRGDVFVINGGSGHGYRSPNNLKIYNVMFRADKLLDTDSDMYKLTGFKELFSVNAKNKKFQSRLTLSHNAFEKFCALLKEMCQEYERKEKGWKTALKADFILSALMLSRAYSVPAGDSKVYANNLDAAITFIENNYTRQISISELASMSNSSERHFARVFRQTYKVTPGNYILELRMQRARVLLKNTALGISEISSDCGFNDSNYFTRQFHQLFGVTPREYRLKDNED